MEQQDLWPRAPLGRTGPEPPLASLPWHGRLSLEGQVRGPGRARVPAVPGALCSAFPPRGEAAAALVACRPPVPRATVRGPSLGPWSPPPRELSQARTVGGRGQAWLIERAAVLRSALRLRTGHFRRAARAQRPLTPACSMASLRAKDAYLQGLAQRICARPSPEPQGRKSGGKTWGTEATGPPSKKKRKAQKKVRERKEKAAEPKAQSPPEKSPVVSGARKPAAAAAKNEARSRGTPSGGPAAEPDSFFALDVLRQRLHEKIQAARGQGAPEALSPAVVEKRRRRKQERERKKRKRKELRAKEKATAGPEALETSQPSPEAPGAQTQGPPGLLFNKVEVGDDGPAGQAQRRKEKRQKVKGNLTPLSGRNYRQLLERLQARRERLEELRERDAGQARALEAKMQWTNLLYKAEGVKIRDDEQRLQDALKRKEKRRAQRQRRWQKRTAQAVEKMQQRQDRRRQNLRRKKAARAERRLEKARRKGRVLPQDLERAGLV
ncbi:Surfeit locus protein 6 [Galemys pyrenaicus]|uniref:Surfeit locus protein 6 n=1 Tax=Galemys pyrenaicus TaxID=202257 RepID=A0A8J5ZT89_GALPY|nr:Surfeit locus protein 6 [Galemys pyrenaicus]